MTSAPHHPNAGHWQAVAYFLAGLTRISPALAAKTCAAAHAKRSAGAAARGLAAAGFQALPDGNHGDNKGSTK